MPAYPNLDFHIAASARSAISAALEKITQFDSLPAIVYLEANETSGPRWMIRFYERTTVESNDFPGLCTVIAGIRIAIPQPQVLSKLNGCTLVRIGDNYDVVPGAVD